MRELGTESKSSTGIISNSFDLVMLIKQKYDILEHLNMNVVSVCFVHAIATRTNVFLIVAYSPVQQGFIFLLCSFCRLKNHCITRYSAQLLQIPPINESTFIEAEIEKTSPRL